MQNQIKTVVEDKYLYVHSPYNPYFIQLARTNGGKWSKDKQAWQFHVEKGQKLVNDLYGSSSELVVVRFGRLDEDQEQEGWYENSCDGVLSLGGYLVAYRSGRDSRPELYADLMIGTIPLSGGSVKHPAVLPSPDAVFEMVVRRDFAERLKLKIVDTYEPLAEVNPLAKFTDKQIMDEVVRRGLRIGSEG